MTASRPKKSGTLFDKSKYSTVPAIVRVLRSRKSNVLLPKPPGLPRGVPAKPNAGKPKF